MCEYDVWQCSWFRGGGGGKQRTVSVTDDKNKQNKMKVSGSPSQPTDAGTKRQLLSVRSSSAGLGAGVRRRWRSLTLGPSFTPQTETRPASQSAPSVTWVNVADWSAPWPLNARTVTAGLHFRGTLWGHVTTDSVCSVWSLKEVWSR